MYKNISIIIIFIISVFAYYTNETLVLQKIKNQVHNQNLLATKDTLETYKTKNNNLVTTITSNMVAIKDLKVINLNLYNEINNLNVKPEVVTVIKYKYKIDTLKLISKDTVLIQDGITKLNFKYDSLDLKFNSEVGLNILNNTITNSYMDISDLQINLDMTTGIYEKNGIKKFFVTSNNKNIKIDTIYGNIIPDFKKPNQLGIGISFGPSIGYDFFNNQTIIGLCVTTGFNYKLK